MDMIVWPGVASGEIRALPSKSSAHRLLICAALSRGETEIVLDGGCGDISATVNCLGGLGAACRRAEAGYLVKGFACAGAGDFFPGESGTTYRLLLPAAATLGIPARFYLSGHLPKRPMAALFEELTAHGVGIRGAGGDCVSLAGRLRGGRFSLPGDVSSQFFSGLALAMPLMEEDSVLTIRGRLESAGYLRLTLRAMEQFGIRYRFDGERLTVPGGQAYRSPGRARVEGDWTNAAVWLAAAAASGGEVRVSGLDGDSLQGDAAILSLLRAFGASASFSGGVARAAGGGLRAICADVSETPDLAPALALLGAAAEGETRLFGGARLRYKESDRLAGMRDLLHTLGGDARIRGDELLIRGGKLRGGAAEGRNDHRLVMLAATAASLAEGPVLIRGAEAVSKSYPDFFRDLARMGMPCAEGGKL